MGGRSTQRPSFGRELTSAEKFIRPSQFAAIFCEDLGIPADYAKIVEDLILSQIEEAQGAVEVDVVDPEVSPDDVVWSEDEVEQETGANGDLATRATSAQPTAVDPTNEEAKEGGDGENGEAEKEGERVEEEVKVQDWKEADCRIIINVSDHRSSSLGGIDRQLDVQIYTHILRDRIEWDLSSPLPPAQFAKSYCQDLGLTGEAIPLIAHAITDELLKHKRDALELELFARTHPEEQAKWEKTPGGHLRVTSRQGAKALVGVWRDWWEREEFGPMLIELSTEEMERREVERTREARCVCSSLPRMKSADVADVRCGRSTRARDGDEPCNTGSLGGQFTRCMVLFGSLDIFQTRPSGFVQSTEG